jgi:hypothetical protein
VSSREEILAEGQERFWRALLEAKRLHGEYLAALVEAEEIRADVEQATGASLGQPAPLDRPDRVEDYGLAEVAELLRRCSVFAEAALLLSPLMVAAAPGRTVGAVLKTCDKDVASRIREALKRSGFFRE